MVVKTRRQGNSMVITIPSNLGIVEGVQYESSVSATGQLIFTPIQEQNQVRRFATDEEIIGFSESIFTEFDEVFKELVDR